VGPGPSLGEWTGPRQCWPRPTHFTPSTQPHLNIHTHISPLTQPHRRERPESPLPPAARRHSTTGDSRALFSPHALARAPPLTVTHSKHLHLPPTAQHPPLIAVCCPKASPLTSSPAAVRPASSPDPFQRRPPQLRISYSAVLEHRPHLCLCFCPHRRRVLHPSIAPKPRLSSACPPPNRPARCCPPHATLALHRYPGPTPLPPSATAPHTTHHA
jgi:hypothetical protein